MPTTSTGEICTPPIVLAPGAAYAVAPDAHECAAVFAPGHTISDVLRYAIECADADEVRAVLDLLADPDA
jgi:hypothetical protein